MKTMIRLIGLISALLFVFACSPSGSGDAQKSAERETVFDPLVKTLERAESVESLSRDRVDQLDRKLEESNK
jgi:hypothetical protein